VKTKKELITLVKNIDIHGTDESFYRFACTYLFGLKRRGAANANEFYQILRLGERNQEAVSKHFGVSGKHNNENIRRWCSMICRYKGSYFADLTLDELRRLFGYCAHEAKIKKMLNS